MKKLQHFRALSDLPFDIKVGDAFTWDSDKKVLSNSSGRTIPMDAPNEPKYFQEYDVITGDFSIGTKVVLPKAGKYEVVELTAGFPVIGKRKHNLSAWTVYLLRGYTKGPRGVIYAVLHLFDPNNTKIVATRVPVIDIVRMTRYWYIHSSGMEVRHELQGRYPVSDAYRTRTGNIFNSKEIAEGEMTRIVGDVIKEQTVLAAKSV